jgi:YHS domain-containing protein
MTREGDEDLLVTEIDPVCGLEIDADRARELGLSLEYEGRTYAFCTPPCMNGFLQHPTAYAAAGRSAP